MADIKVGDYVRHCNLCRYVVYEVIAISIRYSNIKLRSLSNPRSVFWSDISNFVRVGFYQPELSFGG